MKIIIRPDILDWLSPDFPVKAMTVYPFIILRSKEDLGDPRLINHEKIHLRQQIELLIIPFYLWYGIENLIRLIGKGGRKMAYQRISFEREAEFNEDDYTYLTRRKCFEFLKYI